MPESLADAVSLQRDRWSTIICQGFLIEDSATVSPSARAALIRARADMIHAYRIEWERIAATHGRLTAHLERRRIEGYTQKRGQQDLFTCA